MNTDTEAGLMAAKRRKNFGGGGEVATAPRRAWLGSGIFL